MMVRNRYDDPTMKVSVWQKDMQVIGDFAEALACPTPLFRATEPIYAAALKGGHAADDTASVCAVLEAKAGVRRAKRGKKAGKRRAP
jgi:3-hydroxyisobutyrate dehydrogenase-like beta-hydroxyacid dehydrogenase